MRGNAMSGAPIMIGTNQLAKPPIMAGMTMKKIMIRPCEVVRHVIGMRVRENLHPRFHELHPHRNGHGTPPMIPAIIAKTRYIVPMSLWFVE